MTGQLAHRPVVMTGDRGMVVAGHHLAAEAGAAMLREGGNAMDAAIAAAVTLAIAIPFMNGIGGDAVSMWSDAGGNVEAINGSGKLARSFDADALRAQGHERLPERGPLAVSVPGVVAAWGQSLERHGTRSFAEVLARAIAVAEAGVPADQSSVTFHNGPVYRGLVAQFPKLAEIFGAPGSYRLGANVRQRAAARTLRHLAQHGWRAFYEGPLAQSWLADARAQGVLLDGEDLAGHETLFDVPLTVEWRGMQVHAAPPNSQGLALAVLLGLDEHDHRAPPADGSDPLVNPLAYLAHKQAAFVARDSRCADLRRVERPDNMLTREGLVSLAAHASDRPTVSGGGDTATLVVIDADGNAVSWVQSLFEEYGSGVVCAEHGVVLHNRARLETLDGDPVRGGRGGYRPFHTLCPALVTKGGQVAMALATPGDHGQPQSLYQILRRHYEQGLDVQAAVEWPRIRHDAGRRVMLEDRCPASWDAMLRGKGWEPDRVGAWSRLMGGANVIARADDGLLMGGADPRRSCYAIVG